MSGGGFYGGNSGSQNDNAGAKRTIRPIRALMVSQLLSASLQYDNPDGPVVIDDNLVGNVVLCVELLDIIESNNSKRLRVGDATGTTELRLPPYGSDGSELEDKYNKFGNLYGHFRVFGGKPMFDYQRFDFDIHPYQFLYHEIEAARESFHYQGLVPLDQSLPSSEDPVKHENGAAANNNQESLFVGSAGADDDLSERILGIIQGFEDSGDGVTSDYIAAELSIEENRLRGILSRLENDAKVYEIDGSWRAN